jgi:hypothetical protein
MSLILRNQKGSPLTFSEMDNNLTYLESLVQSGSTPSLSDVLSEGNETGENDISVNEGQRIFVPDYDDKGATHSVEIKMGEQFILSKTNKSASTDQGETGNIEIGTGTVTLYVNAKDSGQGVFGMGVDINGNVFISSQITSFGMENPDGDLRFSVVLPTDTTSLEVGDWWNDNGTVKIFTIPVLSCDAIIDDNFGPELFASSNDVCVFYSNNPDLNEVQPPNKKTFYTGGVDFTNGEIVHWNESLNDPLKAGFSIIKPSSTWFIIETDANGEIIYIESINTECN